MPSPGTTTLAELEGLILQGGVAITPVERQGVEEISMDIGEGQQEKFAVTVQNQRVAGTGMVWVYNTRTGEGRRVEVNALKMELGKQHRDPNHPDWLGKRMFTLDQKTVPVLEMGTLLCPLNPAHPDWPTYKAIGGTPCRKHTLPHELAVENHVRIKHPRTWANLERKRQQQLEDEERDYRRWQMGQPVKATPVASGPAASVAEAPARMAPRPVAPPVVREKVSRPERTISCDQCGESFTSTVQAAILSKLKAHTRIKHPSEP